MTDTLATIEQTSHQPCDQQVQPDLGWI